MFMLHVCKRRGSKIACCVEAAHNTHPRATRTSTTPTAARTTWPTLHSAPAPCWCCVLCGLNLCCVRGRHSLAASRGLQPEIMALARRGRNSFDSPLAMMHTRRSSAHVSLTAFCLLLRILRSRYAASCFACRGWLRSAKGTYRGNIAALSSWPSWASTFLPASSQLTGKRILRCGTVEPPQPQARRRAPRRLSRPARPRATALLDGLAGRRSRPSIGRCVMVVGSAKLAGDFFRNTFFRTWTPRSGPP